MAGIYIHIPYCKQACHYCDFHFSTNHKTKKDFLTALYYEISLKANFFKNNVIETLYLGGGTPSLLQENELEYVFYYLQKYLDLSSLKEITIEANPDDITNSIVKNWKRSGINRVSLGVQTLNDNLLRFMNRAHNSSEALRALEIIAFHFDNFSIDIMYGISSESKQILNNDINKILYFNPPHISAYCLTIEPGTVFGKWHEKDKLRETDDHFANQQYFLLEDKLKDKNMIHYEISNYAIPGYISIHNSNYWQDKPYIGFGPGAHSFDGNKRFFNINNNASYIQALKKGHLNEETEDLSFYQRFNEKIITGLRTYRGFNLENLNNLSSTDKNYFYNKLNKTDINNMVNIKNNHLTIKKKKWFLADYVARELLLI